MLVAMQIQLIILLLRHSLGLNQKEVQMGKMIV